MRRAVVAWLAWLVLCPAAYAGPLALRLLQTPAPCPTSTHFAVGIEADGTAVCEALVIADMPSGVTLDTEWDTTGEINTATTDDDFLTLNSTQTTSNKTILGGDSAAGTTRPAGSNIIGDRTHDTDCRLLTDGKKGETCCDADDGKCWVCIPSSGDCSDVEWKRVDADTTCLDAGVTCLFAGSSTEGGPASDVACTTCVADSEIADIAWSKITGVPDFEEEAQLGTTNATGNAASAGQVCRATAVNACTWAFPDWGDIASKPTTFTPSSHTHPTTEITGVNAGTNLTADLEEEAQIGTTVATGNAASAGQVCRATAVNACTWAVLDWGDISGKPTTFTPSAHATNHSLGGSDPITATNLASACTNIQALGGTGSGGVECQTDDIGTDTLDDLTDNQLGDLGDVAETGAALGKALVSDGAGAWLPSASTACLSDGTNCPFIFKTIDPATGTDAVADTSTDTVTFAASGIATVTGSDPDTITFGAVEVDGSTTNELQNLFATISTPSGTNPVADTTTDTLALTAGGICAITGNSTTDTVDFTCTEAQLLFKTVDAPSGTDPVADSITDTLTLAAGGIVTVTGDSTTDTVTIAATETDPGVPLLSYTDYGAVCAPYEAVRDNSAGTASECKRFSPIRFAADCTTQTGGEPGEWCEDSGGASQGERWRCMTTDANCNTTAEWVHTEAMNVYRNNALIGRAYEMDFSLDFDVNIVSGQANIDPGSTITQCGQTLGPSCMEDEAMFENLPATITGQHLNTHIPTSFGETGPEPLIWGSGLDGAFTLPDLTAGNSCGTTAGSGNCPAICTGGCSGTAPSCICLLNPNHRMGAWMGNSTTDHKPSVVLQLTSLTIPNDWTVKINRTVTPNCAIAVSSQLELHVRGDCTINGAIDIKGMGGCGGGSSNTAAGGQAGKAGGSTMVPGGAAGAATPTAGGVGARIAYLSFAPGQPIPMLAGSGGGAAPASGTQWSPGNTLVYPQPSLGSTGGGGGGCSGTPSGSIGEGGNGGGGLVILCTGTVAVDGATITLSGNPAGNGGTTNGAGGGGSGNGLIVGSTITWGTNTVTAAGGTAGAAFSTCSAGGAGGAGQLITHTLAGVDSCYGNCSSY